MKDISITLSRKPTVHNDICYILLATGDVAVCDAKFYHKVKDKNWTLMGGGYPSYTKYDVDGSKETIKLHYLIVGKFYDHKDGNKLNNRLSNLRKATYKQNNANRSKRIGCSSPYKGVRWDKSKQMDSLYRNRWQISYHWSI